MFFRPLTPFRFIYCGAFLLLVPLFSASTLFATGYLPPSESLCFTRPSQEDAQKRGLLGEVDRHAVVLAYQNLVWHYFFWGYTPNALVVITLLGYLFPRQFQSIEKGLNKKTFFYTYLLLAAIISLATGLIQVARQLTHANKWLLNRQQWVTYRQHHPHTSFVHPILYSWLLSHVFFIPLYGRYIYGAYLKNESGIVFILTCFSMGILLGFCQLIALFFATNRVCRLEPLHDCASFDELIQLQLDIALLKRKRPG